MVYRVDSALTLGHERGSGASGALVTFYSATTGIASGNSTYENWFGVKFYDALKPATKVFFHERLTRRNFDSSQVETITKHRGLVGWSVFCEGRRRLLVQPLQRFK